MASDGGSPGRLPVMCGRFAAATPPDELARYFAAHEVAETLLEPRYNVAPTDDVAVVVEREDVRRVDLFHWGFVPFWAKDPSVGNRMINARAEGLLESNAFRRAFERRRCIVPADGFYEWRKVAGQRKKQPVYIRRKDGDPLALAALWEVWTPKEAKGEVAPLYSCTIITGEPNELVAPIHDRMPVILPPEAWDAWLARDNTAVEELQRLLAPAPADLFEAWAVSTDVNTVGNDGPHLVAPLPEEEQPSLF
jgi:putative SOS response-associated peptidase YedK